MPRGGEARRVDYDTAGARYRATRTVDSKVLEVWRAALAPHFDAPGYLVADVGAGTGQFSRPIAEWFAARVVAVEPSSGMRAQVRPHELVSFIAGRGEALPIATGSVQRVWLSAVVHHFADLHAAVDEVRRVLAPRGRVLARGFFADVEPPDWFTSFPGIARSIAMFPTSDELEAALTGVGLRLISTTDVAERHPVAAPWQPRLRALRAADSLLRPLTDAEFEAGMAALAERIPDGEAIVEHRTTLRLIVAGLP